MPDPTTPVIPGLEPYEIVLGANQEGVEPLPVLRGKSPEYIVTSRWHLSEEERFAIAHGADIFLTQRTFGHLYLPSHLTLTPISGTLISSEELERVIEELGLNDELNERLRSFLP